MCDGNIGLEAEWFSIKLEDRFPTLKEEADM